MMKHAAILALLALAACGKKEALKPPAGYNLPPKPATAAKAPTTDEMLTPGPEARPERSIEQIRRSEERKDDPFDLPPSD
jgi:predicted small lipoprotein YifL